LEERDAMTLQSESAVHELLRRRGIRLHDSVIAEIAAMAERDRRLVAWDRLVGIRAEVNGEVVILHPDDVELLYVDV
jgi:hypothetical protein